MKKISLFFPLFYLKYSLKPQSPKHAIIPAKLCCIKTYEKAALLYKKHIKRQWHRKIPKILSTFSHQITLNRNISNINFKYCVQMWKNNAKCENFSVVTCCMFGPANGCFAWHLLVKITFFMVVSSFCHHKQKRRESFKRKKNYLKKGSVIIVLLSADWHPNPEWFPGKIKAGRPIFLFFNFLLFPVCGSKRCWNPETDYFDQTVCWSK